MTPAATSTLSPVLLTTRQISRLSGQVEAIAIIAGELKRELLSLPRQSLVYERPGPHCAGRFRSDRTVDVLFDAMELSQAARRLLRSIGHLPVAPDPDATAE